jgi:hypothetical protein
MAVRCPSCSRLSRDEGVCEWCRKPIPEEARRIAARAAGEEGVGSALSDPQPTAAVAEPGTAGLSATADVPHGEAPRQENDAEVDAVSREEARAAAAAVPEAEREEDDEAEAVEPETLEAVEERQDRDTLVILVLIMVQLALTLYLGGLSSWWSLSGIAWLVVGYGVKERASWSLALPLLLFTIDVALPLFGIGPREQAGLPFFIPLDFFLYALRLLIWGLIWRLRDEMA